MVLAQIFSMTHARQITRETLVARSANLENLKRRSMGRVSPLNNGEPKTLVTRKDSNNRRRARSDHQYNSPYTRKAGTGAELARGVP
jgi:hypothetical protein